MLADYKVSDRLILHFEATTQKEIFQNLATLSEVFSISQCGACDSTNIRHVVREAAKGNKKYQYYELHCQDCRARLAFGQHDEEKNTLFPKRKDQEGNYLQNNGWTKYTPNKQEE